MKGLLAKVCLIVVVLYHGIFAIIGDLVLCVLHLRNQDKTISKMKYHCQWAHDFGEILDNQEIMKQCDELLGELEEIS